MMSESEQHEKAEDVPGIAHFTKWKNSSTFELLSANWLHPGYKR